MAGPPQYAPPTYFLPPPQRAGLGKEPQRSCGTPEHPSIWHCALGALLGTQESQFEGMKLALGGGGILVWPRESIRIASLVGALSHGQDYSSQVLVGVLGEGL